MPPYKKQHLVPECILKAWTDTGKPDGRLLAIDMHERKSFPARPKDVMHESFMYSMESFRASAGVHPQAIEQLFGDIETAATPVLTKLIHSERQNGSRLPDPLIRLLATLHARPRPRLEQHDAEAREAIATHARLQQEGRIVNGDPEIADLVTFHIGNGLDNVQLTQNDRLLRMIEQLDFDMRYYAELTWTVVRPIANDDEFICTDNPVIVDVLGTPSSCACLPTLIEQTRVFVPISPRTALVGMWNACHMHASLSRQTVAYWNGRLLDGVGRTVVSRSDFCFLSTEGALQSRADLLVSTERARRVN